VPAIEKSDVYKAKHDGANDGIKQIMANGAKSFGFSLIPRPSIQALTPLTLAQYFFRGAGIVASPAIDLTASFELS